jgi:N6-adenosine-specific RNA methylase IME4
MVTRSNTATGAARSVWFNKASPRQAAPRIDPEFEKLIPPLQAREQAELENSLVEHGCRDALTTWNGRLLDGHNRLRLCVKHRLRYRVQPIDLPSREAAKIWILRNQIARRNLTSYQRVELALRLEPLLARQAKQRILRGKADPAQNSAAGETRDQIAELAEVSHDTVDKVRLIIKLAAEADKARLCRNELSIHEVYSRIHFKLRQAEIRKQLESPKVKRLKEVEGRFDLIECDPPWPEAGGGGGSKPLGYKLLKLEEIECVVGRQLEKHAAADCHFFLWTTQKFLPVALDLLKKWGFEYGFHLIWHKPGGPQPVGYPQYNHEIILYARLGSPKFVDTTDFWTCFEAPRRTHSEKPQKFYETLRRVTAGRRLALFARRKIEGFTVWGDQAPEEESR